MDFKEYYTSNEEIELMKEELRAGKTHVVPTSKFTFKYLREKLPKILGIAIIVLLVVIIIQIQVDKSQNKTPTVFGMQVYEVKTGSMEPTISQASFILSKKINANSKIEVGDIVTFQKEGKLITHRIISEKNKDGVMYYKTKGDFVNNSIDEGEITRKDIRAKYKMSLPFRLGDAKDE